MNDKIIKKLCHDMRNDVQVALFGLLEESGEEERKNGKDSIMNLSFKINEIERLILEKP